MKYLITFLCVLLSLSLASNWYLYKLVIENSITDPIAEMLDSQQQLVPQAQLNPRPVIRNKSKHPAPDNPESSVSDIKNKAASKQYHRIRNWLLNHEYAKARAELLTYLKQNPDDIDFLLLEADLIAASKPSLYAIQNYYEMLELELTAEQSIAVKKKIKHLASHTLKSLSNAAIWQVLVDYASALLQLEPENPLYIASLAEGYGYLGQTSLMEQTLELLPQGHPVTVNLKRQFIEQEQLARQPTWENDSAERHSSYPLTNINGHFVVEARMRSQSFDLMIDTGATNTVLSERAFAQLSDRVHRQFIGEFNVNTANGKTTAPIYKLSSLRIGNFQTIDVAVVVLPLNELEYADGLLGMNFLRNFDFKIDQRNNRLLLRSSS